jgi:hypothetical protein
MIFNMVFLPHAERRLHPSFPPASTCTMGRPRLRKVDRRPDGACVVSIERHVGISSVGSASCGGLLTGSANATRGRATSLYITRQSGDSPRAWRARHDVAKSRDARHAIADREARPAVRCTGRLREPVGDYMKGKLCTVCLGNDGRLTPC